MGKYSGEDHSQAETDLRSIQLNPNHKTYWKNRRKKERPKDWKDQVDN